MNTSLTDPLPQVAKEKGDKPDASLPVVKDRNLNVFAEQQPILQIRPTATPA